MSNSNSTYSPAAAWNTLLQPFYVLSTVIGILIGASIAALAIRSCARRRIIRRRFVRAVDAGWAVPVFHMSDETGANLNISGPKPVMLESVLNLQGGGQAIGETWEKAMPLSVTLLPTQTSRPYDLLLYLLRSPSIFTPNLFSRLRAIQSVRSNQSFYHHRILPSPSPDDANVAQREGPEHKPSTPSTSPHPNSKARPLEGTTTEPVHVMFAIAMPVPPPPLHQRSSPATAHEPAITLANRELCVGVVSASLRVPVQYLNGERDKQPFGPRHNNTQEVTEVEDDGDYAHTIQSRLPRSEDPGHEYARSFVSSRHMYVGNYGDEGSSYLLHQTSSVSPSYWEDHGGPSGGGGGSVHGTHNSYLAPPSFHNRPSTLGQGRDELSSVSHRHPPSHRDPARSGESSYSPSQAHTPSVVSESVPPAQDSPPPSQPPPSAVSPPPPPLSSSLQPHVLANDFGPPSRLDEDVASRQTLRGPPGNAAGSNANRVSHLTNTTDTTTTITDVEGGYDADSDADRRLSLRPKSTIRRRAGS